MAEINLKYSEVKSMYRFAEFMIKSGTAPCEPRHIVMNQLDYMRLKKAQAKNEKLQAENERLREALRPFANAYENAEDGNWFNALDRINESMFVEARQALGVGDG